VISVTAVELLAIERESFLQFIDTHKTIALKLIHSLCHTARSSNDFLESVVFLNLPVRLAKVLRLLCLKYGEQRLGYVELNARISQGDLASLVGASRESINKQLRSWEDSGLLKIQESGKLHIDEQIIALAEKPSS
jgi:CRP/FNR family cyclic AMP-dependent transcriptional regulator